MLLGIELMAKRYSSKKFLKENHNFSGVWDRLALQCQWSWITIALHARGAWGLHLCYGNQISSKGFVEGRVKTMH